MVDVASPDVVELDRTLRRTPMKKTFTAAVVMAALTALTLTGCSSETPQPSATDAEAQPLLAEYGIDSTDTTAVIDELDRLALDERPSDLMASVRPDELVVTTEQDEVVLDVPEDRFYLSVAPYVDQTHDCFYHSLTTCKGELAAEEVEVQVVDETNDEVLVDETMTTYDNGFVGLWLPRDIEGTLRVSFDGRVGETEIATDAEAPTCLTTLQLT